MRRPDKTAAPTARKGRSKPRQYKVCIFTPEGELKEIGLCPFHYRPVRVNRTDWKVMQGPAEVEIKETLDRRAAFRLAQRLNTL